MIYLALLALLVGFLVGRFARFPGVATNSVGAPLRLLDGGALSDTDHMVFAEPLTRNTYGFITSPRVKCADPECVCRKYPRLLRN